MKSRYPYHILAVDDEPINRLILADLLEETYDLEVVDSGAACFASIEQRKPDLILLDINMPNMSGFDVCRRLKTQFGTQDIPVIFLTAKINIEDERLGFQLGAVDYITKPFTELILLARINTHLSLSHAQKMLASKNSLLKKERDTIESIILTMRDDERFIAENLRLLVTPLDLTNGDIVLSTRLNKGVRHILLGDFTGHGLSAAIAGPLVSSLFYSQAAQGVCLEQTARSLNAELCHKLPTQLFIGALLIEWHVELQRMRVWNCGMPDLLIYRQGKLLQKVPSKGLPLGIAEPFYQQAEPQVLQLQKGDRLFGYSDGLFDARSESQEAFGFKRIETTFEDLLSLGRSLEFVEQELNNFVGQNGLKDDLTLVEIQV